MAFTPIHAQPQPDDGPQVQQKRVIVYLDTCAISGTLVSYQPRVSDFLSSNDEVIEVQDARVVAHGNDELAVDSRALINKNIVLFVVDLSPTTGSLPSFQVEREPHAVTLNVGTLWLRGNVHLPVGGELHSFFAGFQNRFMPVTGASIIGHEATASRTVLVNRDQLRCMVIEPSP